jgi:hypothetical protein
MADPVSWLVIQKGWAVVDREGESVGKVAEVVGDLELDIFTALAVSTGMLATTRSVPAERVGTILDGEVHLDLTADEVEALEPYEP